MCLPIDLKDWKDVDDGTEFEDVLNILKWITNPEGSNPAYIWKVYFIGYDPNKKKSFEYVDTYKNGKHIVEMIQ